MIALLLFGLIYGVLAGGAYQLSVLKGAIDGEEEYKALRKDMDVEHRRKFNAFVDSFKMKDKEARARIKKVKDSLTKWSESEN